jgi:hypothetical protein
MRAAGDPACALAGPEGRQLLQRALEQGPVEIRAVGVSMPRRGSSSGTSGGLFSSARATAAR